MKSNFSGDRIAKVISTLRTSCWSHFLPRLAVDKSIFYYPHAVAAMEKASMAFKLDWATGQSRLTHILTRTPLMGRQLSQKWEGIDRRL